jgi:amino acid transporter
MTDHARDETTGTQRGMIRGLGLSDLVLFNIAAVLGIRWLATSAKAGASSLTMWVGGALFFFVPLGLAVAELSARYPDEGGMYQWTKRRFGEGHGYLCGWCYWICNVIYYPQLLISTAVISTYAIGRGGTGLGDQWTYVLAFTLVALWAATLLNIVGLNTGKWLQNAGGVGSYVTGAVLVAVLVAFVASTHRGPVNPITRATLVPHLGSFETVNLWASIAFAFAGIELIATMGGEIRDPRRNLPRSIFISVPLIVFLYLAGTTAVLWLVPTRDTNVVSGVLQGIAAGTATLGPGFRWLVPAAAAAYTIGTIGCVGTWLVGPARIAFAIGLDRYFPPIFGRVHPRWHTPYVAILVEAGLATLLLFLAVPGKGTTVEALFLVLLDMNLLVYFIPFVYVFLCLLRERANAMPEGRGPVIPGGYAGRVVTAICGLAVTIAAMIVAIVPPPDAHPVWLFELKVVGGTVLFVLLGGIIYVMGRSRAAGPRPTPHDTPHEQPA